MSVSERIAESAADLWDYTRYGVHHAFFAYVYPVVTQLLVLALVGHRIAGEAWLRILEWRPIPDSAALKDVSATAQQIDIRLQQFCYWPIQYLTLRKRRTDWGSVTNSHPEYIRFYNSLWLVANDIIIGIAIGSYIIENSDYVAGQVESIVDSWFIEGLQRMICWLMGYPGGLKLNEDLAQFLGDLFLWIIDYWAECGIRFELRDTPLAFDSPHQHGSVKPDIAPTAHIQLQSVPLPFSETFSQYSQLAYRIRKHYLSPSVFLCLFTGRFVPPIHRKSLYSLQYSMLPAKRIPIAELWKKLMGSDGARKPQANGTASSSTGRRGQNKKDPGHWWSK
ncbi:Gpi1-domain-containing protein [Aureobasidium pullulans]|uniref:Gpi1-domain-containing protein n=1 Tax=Aureobasidium pullulans TaxID=5580 RepID=A0A4T0B5S4_AURPU|nr:Gpi1-domain-containing protein [Aureobasidium pullulans]